MSIESRIRLDGWLNYVLPLFDDKYVIAVNSSYGSLYLINIEDK
jgi:hypothetical protein